MATRIHPDVRTLDAQKRLDYLATQYDREKQQVSLEQTYCAKFKISLSPIHLMFNCSTPLYSLSSNKLFPLCTVRKE